jgi:glyoxylase-like metal-dependent hydrolase (beta-lactamase superfamily II)
MWVTDRVALVGSGRIGYGLTSQFDCNVFVIRGDRQNVLVDAGCGLSVNDIVTRIADAGIEPTSIGSIMLTHSHADHAAGAAALSELLGAEVVAPAKSADALHRGDTRNSAFEKAQATGGYPANMEYPKTKVARAVSDGETIDLGGARLEAVLTRGHSYDHTVYILHELDGRRLLFGGDLLLADGRVLLQTTKDCRLDLYADAVQDLATRRITGLLPGHGPVDPTGAAAILDQAAAQFATRIPPETLR